MYQESKARLWPYCSGQFGEMFVEFIQIGAYSYYINYSSINAAPV